MGDFSFPEIKDTRTFSSPKNPWEDVSGSGESGLYGIKENPG